MNMKRVHMSQTVFRVSQQLVYRTFFTTRSKYTEWRSKLGGKGHV